MNLGDKVLIDKTKQIGTIIGINRANGFLYLKVQHPKGPKVIRVLTDAVTIIKIVRGVIPVLMEIYYILFPSKRPKKKKILILNKDLNI